MCAHSGNTSAYTQWYSSARVYTVVLLVRVHSDITSMCVHTVVILVLAHCGITGMCVCTQW